MIDSVISRLDGVKRSGDGFVAKCPAHEDRHQSLSIGEGADGRVLLKCHAGCTSDSICAAIGMETRDLFDKKEETGQREIVATYDYTDAAGKLLYQVVRFVPKDFRQRRPDGAGGWEWKLGDTQRVLYRLPAVLKAAAAGRVIYVVEGEKDVATLERHGFTATTSPGGAAKWQASYADALSGAIVAVIPDNDDPGREHAAQVSASLAGKAKSCVVLTLPGLPVKGDVTDWLSNGGTPDRLKDMVREAIDAGKPKTKTTDIEAAFFACLDDIERRKRGELVGLPWPAEWRGLSQYVGPLEPGSFTIVAARPSVGKTMFGMQLQRFLCGKGYSVLYVSRELTTTRLIRRHIVARGANMYHLRSGALDDRDRQAIDAFQDDSRKWRVWFDDASRSVDAIAGEVSILKPDCVIVDYLQRLSYDTDREYAAITRIVNDLQDLTLAYNVPLVCLSQLSRPMKGQEHRKPSMSDTRGSGAVEERAANLIMLHRNYTTQKDERGIETAGTRNEQGLFLIEKCADGEAPASVPVHFDGSHMRIVEIDQTRGWGA